MTIATKSKIACIVLTGLTIATVIISAWFVDIIRLGGPMHRDEREMSDLVADILPPPSYIIEPWLEVTLIADSHGAVQPHLERLAELRKAYEIRREYWRGQELPPKIAEDFLTAAGSADEFWRMFDREFKPAVESRDPERIQAAHEKLDALYTRHRKDIDALVAMSIERQQAIGERKDVVLTRIIASISILAALLIGGIIAGGWFLMRHGLRPISQTADSLGRGLDVLASGDLVYRIEDDLPMEYEHLRSSFNNTASGLTTLLSCVTDSANSVRFASDEIRAASVDLSERTEMQATNLKETVLAMNQVTHMVEESARGAADANSAIGEAQDEADEGGEIVRRAMRAMDAIEKSAAEISQIINVIDGIAFQTNLLALNAGVEAARAGEAGRGFAVVANEVRALAQRSADAAKDIKELIKTSSAHVHQGVTLVADTGTKLTGIVERIKSISGLLNTVASASERQSISVSQINVSMQRMDEMTHQNAAMAEQCTAATASLAKQSRELTQLVGTFRLSEDQALHRGTTTIPFAAARGEALARKVAQFSGAAPRGPATAAKPLARGNVALAPQNEEWSDF